MLQKFINNYLKQLTKSGRSKKTIKTYQFALGHFILWCKKENIWFKNLKVEDVKHYTNYLVELSLKPASINLCLTVLKGFYDYLAELNQVQGNPVLFKKIRVNEKKDNSKNDNKEQEVLLNAINSLPPEVKIYFLTMIYSGIKLDEIINLSPGDIFIKQKYVFIRITSKNNQKRYTPILDNDVAKELLSIAIKKINEKRLFNIKKSHIIKYMKDIYEKTGVKCTSQRLRSFFVQNLTNTGCHPDLIKQALGYKGYYFYKQVKDIPIENYFSLAVKI